MHAKNILLAGTVLLASGCDMLRPTLTVRVKAVLPCDQQDALDSVGIMQLRVVSADGTEATIQGSRSKGKASLPNLEISDGTVVFINGYPGEDPAAVEGIPSAVGASAPMNLKAFTEESRFPAARSYPKDKTETVAVPVGKINSFASTTDVGGSTCSSMGRPRHSHTATFSSATGKVYIIGGLTYAEQDGAETFVPKDSALEIYDPSTGTYQSAVGQVSAEFQPLFVRAFHTATELPGGKILVWGGIVQSGADGRDVAPWAVSFVLDPASLSITQLGPPAFRIKRFNHTATLTRSGTSVIIGGGCGCKGSLTAQDIKAGRCPALADTCADGQPRVAALEIYDVATGVITPLTNSLLDKPRAFHSATALEGELVVFAGGDDGNAVIREVEIFRGGSQAGLLKPVTDQLPQGVTHPAAVALPTEDCTLLDPTHPADFECVLVVGGCTSPIGTNGECSQAVAGSTIMDMGRAPASRMVTGPQGNRTRWGHQAFFLAAGTNMVMTAGGRFEVLTSDSLPVSAEILPRLAAQGGGPTPFRPAPVPLMVDARHRFATTRLTSGQVMFTGGTESIASTTTRKSLGSGELFFFPFR
ncbi:MAG: hypothetical protein HY904_20240 [Deltaproteobacteria bacterium]|nr:hypothetical protein [Deltaproteobacteria bacterium]